MKVHCWKTITAVAATASLGLAIGAAPSQAATPVKSAGLSASDLSKLPLTDRHLTKREKANLAVVLRAYRVAEGNSLDVPAFVNSFTKGGVFNDVVAGQTFKGQALGDVLNNMVSLFPDVHRELKQITVHGDVVSVELSIQGTFKGPLPTPAGNRQAERRQGRRADRRLLVPAQRQDREVQLLRRIHRHVRPDGREPRLGLGGRRRLSRSRRR